MITSGVSQTEKTVRGSLHLSLNFCFMFFIRCRCFFHARCFLFFHFLLFFSLHHITNERIRSLSLYYFSFEAIKFSIECLVRSDIRSDEPSRFHSKILKMILRRSCQAVPHKQIVFILFSAEYSPKNARASE